MMVLMGNQASMPIENIVPDNLASLSEEEGRFYVDMLSAHRKLELLQKQKARVTVEAPAPAPRNEVPSHRTRSETASRRRSITGGHAGERSQPNNKKVPRFPLDLAPDYQEKDTIPKLSTSYRDPALVALTQQVAELTEQVRRLVEAEVSKTEAARQLARKESEQEARRQATQQNVVDAFVENNDDDMRIWVSQNFLAKTPVCRSWVRSVCQRGDNKRCFEQITGHYNPTPAHLDVLERKVSKHASNVKGSLLQHLNKLATVTLEKSKLENWRTPTSQEVLHWIGNLIHSLSINRSGKPKFDDLYEHAPLWQAQAKEALRSLDLAHRAFLIETYNTLIVKSCLFMPPLPANLGVEPLNAEANDDIPLMDLTNHDSSSNSEE